MKNNHYIDKLDLPIEIKDGIKSRSSMLRATLRTVDEDDLIQDGLEVVYAVIRRKPNASLPYLMKAINNHYADIQDREVRRKKFSFKSLETGNVEHELDTAAYRTFQKQYNEETKESSSMRGKNAGIMEAIEVLKEDHTFKDIAGYMGKSPKTIRGLLRKYGKAKT